MKPLDELTWEEHQRFEREWHGECLITYGEETKQLTYADRMGLRMENRGGQWPIYDLGGKKVIDIGGGPTSILLKCVNRGPSWVVDPCAYPDWVVQRYEEASITYVPDRGEDVEVWPAHWFDEAWIYNCLQHTDDPRLIIENAKRAAPVLRIFEWIDIPPHEGHPQMLTWQLLDEWIGDEGSFEQMDENGCVGRAYYGVFHHGGASR